MKAPAYLAINPMGKVPAIRHGDTVVTEGGAICAYLADAFPARGPRAAVRRAAARPYYRWMFFGAACIESAIIDRMLERPASVPPMSLGYGSYDATLNALEKAVTPGPFVLGERFSAVDVYLASQIGWGFGHESTRSAAGVRALFGALHRPSGVPALHRRVADAVLAPCRLSRVVGGVRGAYNRRCAARGL